MSNDFLNEKFAKFSWDRKYLLTTDCASYLLTPCSLLFFSSNLLAWCGSFLDSVLGVPQFPSFGKEQLSVSSANLSSAFCEELVSCLDSSVTVVSFVAARLLRFHCISNICVVLYSSFSVSVLSISVSLTFLKMQQTYPKGQQWGGCTLVKWKTSDVDSQQGMVMMMMTTSNQHNTCNERKTGFNLSNIRNIAVYLACIMYFKL